MATSELEVLERIETLVTSLAYRALREQLLEVEKDPKLRKIFRLTGSKSVREISTATGVPRATVSQIWQRWERSGLIVKRGQQFVKVIS